MEWSCERIQVSNVLFGFSKTISGELDRSTYHFTHQSQVLEINVCNDIEAVDFPVLQVLDN